MRFLGKAALIALLTGLFVIGCAPRPIVIGFQGPLTGSAADLGVQGRNGALLAVEVINAGGGVRGRRLQLDPRDDRNEREVAYDLVQEFRDDEVEMVIGPMTSVAGVAVAERVSDAGPLYISPTVSTIRVSGRDDFFYRLQGATDGQARALGEFAAEELRVERVAVVADTNNADYSIPYMAAFTEGLAVEGGIVVQEITTPLDEMTRWNVLVETISANDPDAVLMVASAADTARVTQAVRSVACDCLLLSSGWAATETLLTLGGAAVEGMILARTSYAALEDTEDGIEFQNRFVRRFGRSPSFAARQAYDTALLAARALERARPNAAEVRRELSKIESFDTLLGPVVFDEFGDIEPSTTIVGVERGEFVEIGDHRERSSSQ